MKTFRSLLIAAIRHVLLVWGIALCCITYFSDKPSDARAGWYALAIVLIIADGFLRLRRNLQHGRLTTS